MRHLIVLSLLFAIVNCQFGGLIPKVPKNPVDVAQGAANAAKNVANTLTQSFGDFKNLYKKSYASAAEEALRQNIFTENAKKIAELTKGGILPFQVKINEYCDLVSDEFNKAFNGFKQTGKTAEKPISPPEKYEKPVDKIPESVDWRERGAVTPVKSQQLCAGCWAFSAGGALEGQYFRKTGKLVEISPQNLIDCSGPYGNDGCNGGLMTPAFEYIKANKGVNLDSAYPFEAKNGECRFKSADGQDYSNSGFIEIPRGDEKALEAAVAHLGPVSVAIDAHLDSFQYYGGGVYYDPKCGNTPDDVNHAVLVVGYGVEDDGTKYWLVKNSYGKTWGLDGYIKMAKDRGNHCGIATYASVPKI